MDSNGDIGINGGKIIVYEASTGADQLIDRDGELKLQARQFLWKDQMKWREEFLSKILMHMQYIQVQLKKEKFITITDKSNNNEVFSLKNEKKSKICIFNFFWSWI